MPFIGKLLLLGLDLYMWVIIISVAISWLIAFGVLNTNNPQAGNLIRLLEKATEPVYKPLRRFIPPLGGIDITPMIVIFGIILLKGIIIQLFLSY
jgi:YggT family protein